LSNFKLTYKQFGESAILVEWPQRISKTILTDIRVFVEKIKKSNIKEILEYNFVYSSLLVVYNNKLVSYDHIKQRLSNLYEMENQTKLSQSSLWHIPVCYDQEFGVDLEFLSKEKKYTIEEIISLHSNTVYTVYGIGFLPGFLYLGGLLNQLHTPRRSIPRLEVPKGAIAIGGSQTGIYPQSTPGGWHIVGRTPISLFNPINIHPCPVSPGDKIKFKIVNKAEFEVIKIAQESEVYNINKELYD